MTEICFRIRGGTVLVMVVAMMAAPLHAGTVPTIPEAAAFDASLELQTELSELGNAPLAAELLSPADLIGVDTDPVVSPVLTPQGSSDVLLLLGHYPGSEPAAWSQGFEGDVRSDGPLRSIGSDSLALAPVPEQVLIPLPSAAWTGLTSLACLGLVGFKKRVRRFLS